MSLGHTGVGLLVGFAALLKSTAPLWDKLHHNEFVSTALFPTETSCLGYREEKKLKMCRFGK